MHRLLALAATVIPACCTGQAAAESPIKFAFYSPSWDSNAELSLSADLRLIVDNKTDMSVRLESIEFHSDVESAEAQQVIVDLEVLPNSPAEREFPYIDLLSLNRCVDRARRENWRLVEISNYTLNPLVRRLIIEDTTDFRIHQCIATVRTSWTNTLDGEHSSNEEWVIYHFENSP